MEIEKHEVRVDLEEPVSRYDRTTYGSAMLKPLVCRSLAREALPVYRHQ